MTRPFSGPPRTPVDRGRVALQVLIALTLLITVVGVTAGLASGEKTWPRVVRMIMSVSFSVAAYRGVRWTALAMGVLYLAASVQAAYTAYVQFELLPFMAWAFALGSIVTLAGGVHLLRSPDIRAFQAYQRELRGGRKRARRARRGVAAEREAEEQRQAEQARRADIFAQEMRDRQAQRDAEEQAAARTRLAARQADVERAEVAAQQQRERLRPQRELALTLAAVLAVLALGLLWAVSARVGGAELLRAPSSLPVAGALVAGASAIVGSTLGRFGLFGVALATAAASFASYLSAPSDAFAPWVAHAFQAHLVGLVLAVFGLAVGIERRAEKAALRERILRGVVGTFTGVLSVVVCGRPPLLACAPSGPPPGLVYLRTGEWEGPWRCSMLRADACAQYPGCHAVPGACTERCALAQRAEECAGSCSWQEGKCVAAPCVADRDQCGPRDHCSWVDGACTLACPSASQELCGFVSGCRWVECAGEPTRACSDFAYDECPRQACRRTAR